MGIYIKLSYIYIQRVRGRKGIEREVGEREHINLHKYTENITSIHNVLGRKNIKMSQTLSMTLVSKANIDSLQA